MARSSPRGSRGDGDADTGAIVIGGGALGGTKKFRNVQQVSTVAFVVDDLATIDPWAPRGIEIRGKAAALTAGECWVIGKGVAQLMPTICRSGSMTATMRSSSRL
ncbi:hypothetical protein ABZ912_25890 [Nonomuraea angiospora]|uniref:hypothetical protein n=1 Tax=Nonomuraea angiospora TaxID=46172 RepID=UPI0034055E97